MKIIRPVLPNRGFWGKLKVLLLFFQASLFFSLEAVAKTISKKTANILKEGDQQPEWRFVSTPIIFNHWFLLFILIVLLLLSEKKLYNEQIIYNHLLNWIFLFGNWINLHQGRRIYKKLIRGNENNSILINIINNFIKYSIVNLSFYVIK